MPPPSLLSLFFFCQASSSRSLALSPQSASASSHHVNYTVVLFSLLFTTLLFLSPTPPRLLLPRCQLFARVCSGCWYEGGRAACAGAQLHNKRPFSVIWLAQIRGLLVLVLRRWRLQQMQAHSWLLSEHGWRGRPPRMCWYFQLLNGSEISPKANFTWLMFCLFLHCLALSWYEISLRRL